MTLNFVYDLLANSGVMAFSATGVLIAGGIVGGVGLIIGILLGIASKVFYVEVDERVSRVRDFLPGSNCGGCGFAGCDALAVAIVEGKAELNACPGGNVVEIGNVMGKSASAAEKKVAFVQCRGTCDKTEVKYHYHGLADCQKLALIPGHGEKVCPVGCMGYGTCVKSCKFDAINVVNGVAVVNTDKCIACGACVKTCPNALITLIPAKSKYMVGCSSKQKGKDVKAACSTGCIACNICVKQCEVGAVVVENNIARIDPAKCTGCGKCAEKCPQKIITKLC